MKLLHRLLSLSLIRMSSSSSSSSSSSTSTHTLAHPTLGLILGALSKPTNTIQYRGLPYAHIPGRFRDPILVNSLTHLHTSAPFDGTKWGHIAIQQLDAEEMDAKILNTPVLSVGKERKEMDELRCANLVVTTPDSERGKKLPVIVWAHGGAYKVGSANFAAYDTVNIVRHSVEIGMPVVVISINRRLNSLGSTATPELGRSTESGNWLLKDEKCALEWVQRQVAGFGGDPENITYFGESAGSCSGSIHLYSQTRLFDRAILLSGLAGLLPPRPVEAQHEYYLELCEKLNITTQNPQQRAAAFLEAPAIDIAKLAFDVQTVPTSDGTLIPSHSWIRHENFKPNPQWCKSVLIGTCRDEWAVMALGGGIEKYAHPAAVFRQRLMEEAGVSPEDVELLFRLFKVSEVMKWEEQVKQLYVMISDYGFRRPAWEFADYNAQLGRKTYLVGMYMGSPFDGVNKGRAHHAIDIVFSFQNFLEHFPKEGGYIELAKRMTTAWIKYAYDEDPWTPYNDRGVLKVFDVGAKEREARQSEIDPAEWERWKVMQKVGLDRVWKEGQRLLESGPVRDEEPASES